MVLFGFASKQDIESYTKYIDDLIKEDKLTIKEYPDRSYCGGAIRGYFLDNKLVYINSSLGVADYAGFTDVYFRDTSIVKIKMREFFPVNDSTSTDSTYVLLYTNPIERSTITKQGMKVNSVNDNRVKQLQDCAMRMKKEILSIKQ